MYRNQKTIPDWKQLWIPAVLFTTFALFGQYVLMPAPLHGDEAHYLMMAISLAKDGDLNLYNNYENKDYLSFQSERLQPQRAIFEEGRIYSAHAPGLAALIAWPYRLGGRRAVMLLMNFLAAAALWGLCQWILQLGFSSGSALTATLICGMTLPWIMMSGMIFPEIPAGFLLIWSFNRIRPGMPFRDVLISMALFSLLPWFHIKFAVFSVWGFAYLIYFAGDSRKLVWRSLVVPAVSAFLLSYSLYEMYGDPLYLVKIMSSGFNPPWQGLAGLLLDREAGLLVFSPVFALWFFHLPLLRTARKEIVWLDFLLLLYMLLCASWLDWYSGHCPPARYLVPLLPVMSVGMVFFLSRISMRSRFWLLGILGGYSILHVAGVIRTIPEAAIIVGDGLNRVWWYNGVSKAHPFPSIMTNLPGRTYLTAGWLLLIVLGILWTRFQAAGPEKIHARYTYISFLLAGSIGLAGIATGFVKEKIFRRHFDETSLPEAAPVPTAPGEGSVWRDRLPELRWKPVKGADGYLWEIIFPDGSDFRSEVYWKTELKIPDSVLKAIPEGTYRWRIVPLREGRRGLPSPWRRFIVEKSAHRRHSGKSRFQRNVIFRELHQK